MSTPVFDPFVGSLDLSRQLDRDRHALHLHATRLAVEEGSLTVVRGLEYPLPGAELAVCAKYIDVEEATFSATTPEISLLFSSSEQEDRDQASLAIELNSENEFTVSISDPSACRDLLEDAIATKQPTEASTELIQTVHDFMDHIFSEDQEGAVFDLHAPGRSGYSLGELVQMVTLEEAHRITNQRRYSARTGLAEELQVFMSTLVEKDGEFLGKLLVAQHDYYLASSYGYRVTTEPETRVVCAGPKEERFPFYLPPISRVINKLLNGGLGAVTMKHIDTVSGDTSE